MLEKEIIEKKIINAKEVGENLQHHLSPEESKAVYLKKMDGAQQGAEQLLSKLSIHDGNGNVVASSDYGGDLKDKYEPNARQEDYDCPVVTAIHGSEDNSAREMAGRIARYIVDPLAPLGDAVEWMFSSASDHSAHTD
ncbi:hypothetical protein BH10CYA1_BH10CYA1_30060 [soil metagenome]